MDQNKKINLRRLSFSGLLSVLLIIIFAIAFSFSTIYDTIKSFYLVCVFINLYNIFLFRRNPAFLLFFIFCLFYTLSLVPYYFYGLDVSPWKDFNQKDYYDSVLRIHGCFLVTPLLFNPKKYKDFKNALKVCRNPNAIGFIIFCVISFLVIILGQSGSTIFESGGYATGESSKSTLYEYFILFYLATYYYSDKKPYQKVLLVSLVLIYVYKSLLYGGRIEVVQLLLLCFYIFIIDYKIKIKPIRIIIGCMTFYYINMVFSGVRSNPLPLLEGNYAYYLNPFKAYSNTDASYISSNEGDVIQSSVRLIGLIENGLLDIGTRVKALAGFLLSIILPSSMLPEEASLITYKKEIYNSGGGGLAAVYFYAFLSWLGPFMISAYLFFVFRLTFIYRSNYFKLYCLMVFSTFPRWFAYNPIILFKLSLWIVPIIFFSNLIFSFLRKEIKKTTS